MKMYVQFVVLLVVGLLMAANVHAAEPKLYMGAKVGQMMIDVGGSDDATNVGFVLGMTLNEAPMGSISIEGEITTSIADGKIYNLADWDVTTLAAYGVFRTNGQIYFKGKLGLLYEDVSVSNAFVTTSGDDIGISLGFGGGFRVSDKVDLELEYTVIESDLDFLSIGFNMHF